MIGTYDAWSVINLDHLKNNLNVVRNCLNSKTLIMAIVKADAYGHGLCEIAQKLCNEGIDYFGVASIEEGNELVNSGINLPILILRSILPEQMPVLLDSGLIPSVNCIPLAEKADVYGKYKNKKVKIHVRIDTGADGDGIPYSECSDFFEELSKMEWIEIEGIYTHLTSAYGQEDETVHNQLQNFRFVIDLLHEKGIHVSLIHAASSPAIFSYPESHFNMVRAGTVLYGIPFVKDGLVNALKPVMQLKSRVVCIKEFKDGCSLGYGADYSDQRNLRIAHIPIGYADAPFLLGAKDLKVLIGGRFAAVYGNANMDCIKVDISEMKHIETGDEVVIFGEQKDEFIDAYHAAQASGISKVNCESICFLGKRVTKLFVENDAVISVKI